MQALVFHTLVDPKDGHPSHKPQTILPKHEIPNLKNEPYTKNTSPLTRDPKPLAISHKSETGSGFRMWEFGVPRTGGVDEVVKARVKHMPAFVYRV